MANNQLATVNQHTDIDWSTLEKVVIQGDLSNLEPPERLAYYRTVCQSVGLNPATQPFEYLRLSNKLTLYAKRDATDQLRRIHNVSVTIVGRERIEDVYVVTARATIPNGRTDESTGVVSIGNLRGDNLANAFMKAETKAKRRVTLSICGLGMLDETETETIRGAVTEPAEHAHSEQPARPQQQQNQPASEPTPTVDEDTGEILDGEYSEAAPEITKWAEFWNWARSQRIGRKAQVEQILGDEVRGMTPAEAKAALEHYLADLDPDERAALTGLDPQLNPEGI